MKHILKLVLVVALPLFISCSSDDTVSPVLFNPFVGDVLLESQAEVDDFASNNYTEINGSLRISAPNLNGPSNITNLSGLSTIATVNGDLSIFSNSMVSLEGLEGITAISGSLFISFNPELTQINALSNLESIGGDVSISSQDNLVNINGLSGLTSIPGFLTIGIDAGPGALDIPNLANLNGLSQITSVGGDIQIAGTNISNLNGLEGIQTVNGNLTISFNNNLNNLSGIQNIANVAGDFTLTQNATLENTAALTGLQQVEGNFEISSNEALVDTDGLTNLTTVGGFVNIYFNNSLTSFGTGFTSLESAEGVFLQDGALEEISQFNALVSSPFVSISNNPNLTNLSGFESIADISTLVIFENTALATISGFNNLSNVNALEIIQPATINDGAITISGFDVLTTIGNRITVSGLANQNIDFLTPISQVGGNVNISNNENLSDLCGLNTLVFGGGLEGNFNIFQNLYNPTFEDMLNGNCSL